MAKFEISYSLGMLGRDHADGLDDMNIHDLMEIQLALVEAINDVHHELKKRRRHDNQA